MHFEKMLENFFFSSCFHHNIWLYKNTVFKTAWQSIQIANDKMALDLIIMHSHNEMKKRRNWIQVQSEWRIANRAKTDKKRMFISRQCTLELI